MKLFDVLVDEAPNRVFLGLVLGVITGATYSLLIPLVMASAEPSDFALFGGVAETTKQWLFFEVANHRLALAFFITLAFILSTKTISQLIMARVAMNATINLRKKIYRRINQLPIANLERIGTSNFMAAVTQDVPGVISGARAVHDLIIYITTVSFILLFLAFINLQIFAFILLTIVFGLVTYQLPMSVGEKRMNESRAFVGKLYDSLWGIIQGAKELKLNRRKRETFFDEELMPNEQMIRKKEREGFVYLQLATNYGDMLAFMVIGVMVFVLVNYQQISSADLLGILMGLIYLTSPISGILQTLPLISMGKISTSRLNDLFNQMEQEHVDEQDNLEKPKWQQIRLEKICYDYQTNSDSHENFTLGPVSFSIKRGEITFIVGGNGSGKSTLSKMITQHYIPTSGVIYFDDVAVDSRNRDLYRHEISAIYSDFYLFSRILAHNDSEVDARIGRYLDELGLKDKVSVQDGRFSTTALSDGQKRRMALLVALLDDCNFYIFDEWAADQDPSFKEVFYREVLPELKAQGKAVLVISHDDRYFDAADTIVWMESGQLAKLEYNQAREEEPCDSQSAVLQDDEQLID